jgi:hypothetical protein
LDGWLENEEETALPGDHPEAGKRKKNRQEGT